MNKYFIVINESTSKGKVYYDIIYAYSKEDAIVYARKLYPNDTLNVYDRESWYTKYKDLSDIGKHLLGNNSSKIYSSTDIIGRDEIFGYELI